MDKKCEACGGTGYCDACDGTGVAPPDSVERSFDFCEFRHMAGGWEYDLFKACGDKPIKVYSKIPDRCPRCSRRPLFIPEPFKPMSGQDSK